MGGIVAAVTGRMAEYSMYILELQQFSDPTTLQFFMRVHFRCHPDVAKVELFSDVNDKHDIKMEMIPANYKPKVLIMVSKIPHCLVDLLSRWKNGGPNMEVVGVVSNHLD